MCDTLIPMRKGNPKPTCRWTSATAPRHGGRPKGCKDKNPLTVERVETEIKHLALFDPRKLIKQTKQGRTVTFSLREFAELPDEVAACISSYDVVVENLGVNDDKQDTVVKIRWYDKREMLALLAKHFKYVDDKSVMVLDEKLIDILNHGRQISAEYRAERLARLAADPRQRDRSGAP
jgi:hypothetical protein